MLASGMFIFNEYEDVIKSLFAVGYFQYLQCLAGDGGCNVQLHCIS